MKAKLFCSMLLILTVSMSVAKDIMPEKRIYLLDLSGSMDGYGSVRTDAVFAKAVSELKSTVEWVGSEADFVIIPFDEHLQQSISGSSTDKDPIIRKIDELAVQNSNTDIALAWEKGLTELDSNKINYLFLISDGYHNRGVPKQELYKVLREWPSETSDIDAEAYFVLLSPGYRITDVCRIFDESERMQVVESMNVSRNRPAVEDQDDTTDIIASGTETFASQSRDIRSRTGLPLTDTKSKCKCGWLWWVLIALIAILMVYLFVKYVLPSLLKGISLLFRNMPKGGKIMHRQNRNINPLPRKRKRREKHFWKIRILNYLYIHSKSIHKGCVYLLRLHDALNDIKIKSRSDYGIILSKLPEGVQQDIYKFDATRKPTPHQGGHFKGERGNSAFELDLDFQRPFSDGRGKPITVGQLIDDCRKDFGIKMPNKVKYHRKRIDFKPFAIASVKIRYEDVDPRKIEKRGGGDSIQDIAAQKFERKLSTLIRQGHYKDYFDFKDGKGEDGEFVRNTPLVPHEDYDGRTILLVPTFLHNYLSHYGGVAVANIVVESNGRLIGPLI